MRKTTKEIQNEVLKAFQEEIPSIYYSDKSQKEYVDWKNNMEHFYRMLVNFPPEMFNGKKLLDLGAGTGENTVYFDNWGATCTLVEMNILSHNISKDVFKNYSVNYDDHNFLNTSIYDFHEDGQFDIVHSRGVFAHTNDPEKAFGILASQLKKGGYLIYGDGNKSGNLQNMLQRLIIFNLADEWDKMVEVAEALFSVDLDRAQKYANRRRRCIIFDKWVVPRLTNPSVKEVLSWFEENNIKFYSSYPPILIPVLSDSLHNKPRFDISSFKELTSFTESFWLMNNETDTTTFPTVLNSLNELSEYQYQLTDYVDDFNAGDCFEKNVFFSFIDDYVKAVENVEMDVYLNRKTKKLMNEIKEVIELSEEGNLDKIKKRIDSCEVLFKGGNGVRHIDFIGYKE